MKHDDSSGLNMLVQSYTDMIGISALLKAALENFLDEYNDALFIIDSAGGVLQVNESASRLLGRDKEQCYLFNLASIFTAEDWVRFQSAIDSIEHQTAKGVRIELSVGQEPEIAKPFLWHLTPYLPEVNGESSSYFYSAIGRDLTDLRAYQDQLRLKARMQELHEFTTMVATCRSPESAFSRFYKMITGRPETQKLQSAVMWMCKQGKLLRFGAAADGEVRSAWTPDNDSQATLLHRGVLCAAGQTQIAVVASSQDNETAAEKELLSVVTLEFEEGLTPDTSFLGHLQAMTNSLGIALEIIARAESLREKGRKELELRAVESIQESLLPKLTCKTERYTIDCVYRPAEIAAGDWFTYQDYGSWLLILCGDVTGHGVPSAIVTSVVAGAAKSRLDGVECTWSEAGNFLIDLAQSVNSIILDGFSGDFAMTMNLLAVGLDTGEISFVNAGHTAPLLVDVSLGKVRPLVNRGAQLGKFRQPEFRLVTDQLQPHERIFLYSDGLVENLGSRAKPIRLPVLERTLLVKRPMTSSHLEIHRQASAYWGETELEDDVTTVLFEWYGMGGQRVEP